MFPRRDTKYMGNMTDTILLGDLWRWRVARKEWHKFWKHGIYSTVTSCAPLSSIKAHSDISASGPLCIYSDQDYYYSVEKTLEPEVQLRRICFIIQKNSIHCIFNVWWWPGRFHNDKQVMWKHMIYNIVVYTYRCGDDWPVAVVQLIVPQLAVRLRAVAPLLLRHPVRRVLPRRARHRVHVHHQGARVRQLATRRARVTLVTAATCPQHTTNRVYFLFC